MKITTISARKAERAVAANINLKVYTWQLLLNTFREASKVGIFKCHVIHQIVKLQKLIILSQPHFQLWSWYLHPTTVHVSQFYTIVVHIVGTRGCIFISFVHYINVFHCRDVVILLIPHFIHSSVKIVQYMDLS